MAHLARLMVPRLCVLPARRRARGKTHAPRGETPGGVGCEPQNAAGRIGKNNICEEITYQRVKTVITGKRQDGSEYSEGIPANVKYYHTDFVPKSEEYLADSLLNHVTEMIQLEHGVRIDDDSYIIIMSDDEADELERKWNEYTDIKAIYVSQDVLLTASQEALFGSVDTYIIPDYYFNFELREAGELW